MKANLPMRNLLVSMASDYMVSLIIECRGFLDLWVYEYWPFLSGFKVFVIDSQSILRTL